MVTELQKYNHERSNIHLIYQQYLKTTQSKLDYLTQKDYEVIKESFMRSFGKLLREIAKWQRIGDLKSIGWISLMFIRNSIKSGDYEFRWDLYDENRDLFRNAPIFYWSPEELFSVFEEEVISFFAYNAKINKSLNEEKVTIVKEVLIENYFILIERICQNGMDEIVQYDAWKNVGKSDNIKVSIENFFTSDGVLYTNKAACW